MKLDIDQQAFFALVKAGLWEQDVRLSQFGLIDFNEVYRLAEEQSVVGLVAAGIERVVDVKVPKQVALTFVGSTLQLEQQNQAMNGFVAELIDKLRNQEVYAILVKGQGVAQCYEKPLWRACGDVDLLLSDADYKKAKTILVPMSSTVEEEDKDRQHIAFIIEDWVVELHGSLKSGLWDNLDKGIDDLHSRIFDQRNVRSWLNENTPVLLPRADEDVVFVFTHILQHFFRGGIGLRQICDWCRLLWTYQETLDYGLLELWIRKLGIMSEWKAFAYLAVNILGTPEEVMPLYSLSLRWKRKSERVLEMVLEAGNFGHNRDMSYVSNRTYFVRKSITFGRLITDSFKRFLIFPLDSTKVWSRRMACGITRLFEGK